MCHHVLENLLNQTAAGPIVCPRVSFKGWRDRLKIALRRSTYRAGGVDSVRATSRFVALAVVALMIASSSVVAVTPGFADYVQPRGNYVSLETHRLYYDCVGTGSPVVVIEHGIGGAALEWIRVQDMVAAQTRVCTYDRAGYGFSDTGPGPRTVDAALDDLSRLLKAIDAAPPYVLVGHSYGGLSVRYFAARYPSKSAGLVLIESSQEQVTPQIGHERRQMRHALNESAITRTQYADDPYVAATGFLNSRRKAVFAQMDELGYLTESAKKVAAFSLPMDLPLTVITRDPERSGQVAFEDSWATAQKELATLTEKARLVVLRGADHNPHLTHPERISQLITEMVTAVR